MSGDKEYGGNILRSEQTHVSLIILNWNGWNDTIECLESVLKSKYENYHIILIDNFSEDNSIEKVYLPIEDVITKTHIEKTKEKDQRIDD